MKHSMNILLGITFLAAAIPSLAQRRLTEATIAYDIVINTSNKTPQAADLLDGATSVIYLKGTSSRSEMISSLGTQATIIDGKSGDVTILKDYGEQKYMIKIKEDDWKDSNKRYKDIKFTYFNEFKTI